MKATICLYAQYGFEKKSCNMKDAFFPFLFSLYHSVQAKKISKEAVTRTVSCKEYTIYNIQYTSSHD